MLRKIAVHFALLAATLLVAPCGWWLSVDRVAEAQVATEYVYWADSNADKISRRAVDGSGSVTTIASGASENVRTPVAMAVSGSYVYWADNNSTAGISSEINRRAVDGTGSVGTIASGTAHSAQNPTAIAVSGGYVYWGDREINGGTRKVSRRPVDGSGGILTIASGTTENVSYPRAIAVSGGYVYWADDGVDKISRRAVDGSGSVTTIASGNAQNVHTPTAIAVSGGYVYWADGGADKISRRAVDGTGSVTTIAAGLSQNVGFPMAIAVSGDHVYWADNATDKISRRAAGGSGSVHTIASGSSENVSTPRAIAVSGNFVYWADGGVDKISRRAVDGSGSVTTIATGSSQNVSNPTAIALLGGELFVERVVSGNITSAGAMALRWAAPEAVSGVTITGYDYRYKLSTAASYGNPVSLAQTATTATVSGLNAASRYDFQVRARTSTETGDWSTAAELPTTGPSQIIAQVLGGNVRISWTTPTGDAPDQYQIARQQLAASETPMCPTAPAGYAEITTTTTRPAASPFVDTAPLTNHRYCYLVRAQYDEDDASLVGGYSAPALVTVGTVTVPPPVTTGASAEAASSKSLTVSWSLSSSARLYRVQWKSGSQDYGTSREQTAAYSPLVIPDLEPNTTYTLRIRSERDNANSAWSDDFTATTNMASTPAQPNSLRLVDRDESSVSFTWNSISDEDHPVTEWVINYRAAGQSAWTELTSAPGEDGSPVEYTIPTLTPGLRYQVRVRGRNAIGLGGWSITRTFPTTEAPLRETAPKDLRAVLSAQTSTAVTVNLTWQPLAGNRIVPHHPGALASWVRTPPRPR